MVDAKYVAVAVVVVLVVGYFAVYQKGFRGSRPGVNASVVILAALDRVANLSAYSMSFNTTVDGRLAVAADVIVAGEKGRVDVVDGFGIQSKVYFLREGTFACIKDRNDEWICAKHGENESFLVTSIVNRGGNVLNQQRLGNITRVREWLASGVLLPRDAIVKKSVAGRQCDEVEYRTDYSAMSDADLAAIGLNRGIAPYRYQVTRQCLDVATGFALRTVVNLTEFGVNRMQETVVGSFKPGAAGDVAFAFVGGVVDSEVFAERLGALRERQKCRLLLPNETAAFDCFEQAAYAAKDVSYCVEIGVVQRRDQCVLTLVALRPLPALCEEVVGLKNDCYFEVALKINSTATCGKITEVPRSKVCAAEVGVDVGGCAGAASVQEADQCRFVVATRGGGVPACQQITNSTLRGQCVSWFV